jgi:hypothetical protein
VNLLSVLSATAVRPCPLAEPKYRLNLADVCIGGIRTFPPACPVAYHIMSMLLDA